MTDFIPDRYSDESRVIDVLASQLALDKAGSLRIEAAALDLLQAAQTRRKAGEIESFLRQYGLETKEGVALVCLAEALLRVPDAATANDLIRDKVGAVNWLQSRMESADWMVRAARYGLSFTKTALSSMVGRLGEPLIRQAMVQGIRMLGRQFVLGTTLDDALAAARSEMGRGLAFSFDMLGEGARHQGMADRYFADYQAAIETLIAARRQGGFSHKNGGISVKLSALHPRYTPLQADRCHSVLVDRLLHLCQMAAQADLTVTVDAEETERLTLSLSILETVARHSSLHGYTGLGLAVQAYQKYAPDLIDHVLAIGRETGRPLRVRLVKGAYWDTEIKRAQVMGLPDYPVFTRKVNTDLSYLVCAQKMLLAGGYVYPMFATHNAHSVAAVLDFARAYDVGRGAFEFQRLQGMGAALHDVVLDRGLADVTVYAPVGTHEDLLAYLVRRLLENGANTSFVNKLNHADGVSVALVPDPVSLAVSHPTRRHSRLPLPQDLYGPARRNSRGYDVQQEAERAALHHARGVVDVPSVTPTPLAELPDMVRAAHRAFPAWRARPASDRAAILQTYADLLERNAGVFIDLCAQEGGKTLLDAQAEVREAVDFARYYASEAVEKFAADGVALPGPTGESNRLILTGRGPFVCISPWNFPLAIFSGQVSAALAAGNTVLAKPAPQTPRIAALAVHLLHEAGCPADVVQLVVGEGIVGAALVAADGIAGVAFTGSTDVARIINRTLAAKDGPIVPLIAETGGQNAMIVDSTALLENVCDDVVTSAFGSAGQRCSALRVLYVQNDIADRLMGLIAGAMAELRVGDPGLTGTDIGPVIDAKALQRLIDHERYLDQIGARLVARTPLAPGLTGTFFAPVAYEIGSIGQLPGEVFGPILHIIRFDAAVRDRVIAEINSTGFGLTFGLQTRIDARMDQETTQIDAGNLYINRSMIGAVVGVQPFGGQGLSGTGPKAGGPNYLLRFAHEKTITRNTAASGGNIDLVAGGD